MTTEDSKTCSKCGEAKPLTDYPKNGRGGVRADCKACHAAARMVTYHADLERSRAANRTARRKAYASDPEKYKARVQEWRKANPDKHLAISVNWAKANPEKVRANANAWARANPETVAAANRRRRARLANVESSEYTRREIYDRDNGTCQMCGVTLAWGKRHAFHIDHIVPLSLGGPNIPANVQLLCPPCNRTKNAKLEGQIHLPV